MNSDNTQSVSPQRITGERKKEKLDRLETAKLFTICLWQFAQQVKSLTDDGQAVIYFQILFTNQFTLALFILVKLLQNFTALDKTSLYLFITKIDG